MVEGHLGACICGSCLTEAYRAVELVALDDRAGGTRFCTMCREERDEPFRSSVAGHPAAICRRCIRMAAKSLARDTDANWAAPTA